MAKQNSSFFSPNTLVGLAVAAVALFVLFVLARGIFWLLSLLAPVFLIATLFLDHTVFLRYGKWIARLLKERLLMGLVVIALTIVAYPLVAAMLFGQAYLNHQLKGEPNKGEPDEFIEFKEVEELELKPPHKEKASRRDGDFDDYEELFD